MEPIAKGTRAVNSEHFTDAELACKHCHINGCTQELVDALEALRAVAGAAITIDSAYRCPEHNQAVRGVRGSEHTLGQAADIKIAGMGTRRMYQLAIEVPAFASGGIGVAAHQGYIHVDVRGHHARWLYDIAGNATSMWDSSLDEAPEVRTGTVNA